MIGKRIRITLECSWTGNKTDREIYEKKNKVLKSINYWHSVWRIS